MRAFNLGYFLLFTLELHESCGAIGIRVWVGGTPDLTGPLDIDLEGLQGNPPIDYPPTPAPPAEGA